MSVLLTLDATSKNFLTPFNMNFKKYRLNLFFNCTTDIDTFQKITHKINLIKYNTRKTNTNFQKCNKFKHYKITLKLPHLTCTTSTSYFMFMQKPLIMLTSEYKHSASLK